MTLLQLRAEQQRQLFLIASGMSTAGSFAGITAKGWILMKGGVDPFVLALNFAALSLPTLLVSGPAGVRTDRVGCEQVLVQAQWALLAASGLGALAIPLLEGTAQVLLLLFSTLLVGIAGAYESDGPQQVLLNFGGTPRPTGGLPHQLFGGVQRGQAGGSPDRRVVAGGHWPGLGPGH